MVFRTLSRRLVDAGAAVGVTYQPDDLFAVHPLQLSRWLEEAWAAGGVGIWPGLADSPAAAPTTVRRLQLPDQPGGGLLDALRSGVGIPGEFSPVPALGMDTGAALPWDHLVYAYLVESTGVVEILREVVHRYTVGESLEANDDLTYSWMRTTEELFFREPPLFSITSTVSALRPDPRVNRRNAYWRMFGLDLPHPVPALDGQPWKSDVGAAANVRFGEVWLDLLRQVWKGIENDQNESGANPTDPDYIAYLCRTLGEMMSLRRRAGMLAREEFAYVVMMSWFHLLLESDNRVVRDLQAAVGEGGNPADRLTRIALRVGVRPAPRARELFELADIASPVLMFIQSGQFNNPTDAQLLFHRGSTAPAVQETMLRLINLWQSATGALIKEPVVRVASTPAPAQPTRLPAFTVPSTPALSTPNGAPVGAR